MQAVITIVAIALATGCATGGAQKKKKNEGIQTPFPEDVITPQDAVDFTDKGTKFTPKTKFSRSGGEDFTLDGSGEYETWDAATRDEDLAATANVDTDVEQDTVVYEPLTSNAQPEKTVEGPKDALPPPAVSDPSATKVQVLYTKREQVPVYGQPDERTPVKRTLDKGDTVVGSVEGEWARLREGEWVPMKDLSWNPVSRGRTGSR